jgi:hypothetical protein
MPDNPNNRHNLTHENIMPIIGLWPVRMNRPGTIDHLPFRPGIFYWAVGQSRVREPLDRDRLILTLLGWPTGKARRWW